MLDEKDNARKIRAEYMRKWRSRNPDKVRLQNERYWLKKARKAEQEANNG